MKKLKKQFNVENTASELKMLIDLTLKFKRDNKALKQIVNKKLVNSFKAYLKSLEVQYQINKNKDEDDDQLSKKLPKESENEYKTIIDDSISYEEDEL